MGGLVGPNGPGGFTSKENEEAADRKLKTAGLSTDEEPGTGEGVNVAPVVRIISPTDTSTVTGTVVVRVDASDAEDYLGTLWVEVSTDGGATWNKAEWALGSFYDYQWQTPVGAADAQFTLVARAADKSANETQSAAVPVIVNNDETGKFASVAF